MSSNNKVFVWTDELVKEFAELYRYSSSRATLEQFVEMKQKEELNQVTHFDQVEVQFGSTPLPPQYNLLTTKHIPKEQFHAIKQAIEAVLNPNTDSYISESSTSERNITDAQVERKVPIYKTEDNWFVYEKDTYPTYKVDYKWDLLMFAACDAKPSIQDNRDAHYFHSKEKAEEYILQNKPCLSLNDLLEVWGEKGDYYKSAPLFLKFQEKAKTILNGK